MIKGNRNDLLKGLKAISEEFIKTAEWDKKSISSDLYETILRALLAQINKEMEGEDFINFEEILSEEDLRKWQYGDDKPERKNRRKEDAVGRVTTYPEAYIIPTFTGYQNAVSLNQEGKAYLQPLITTDNLQFKEGKLYFKGSLQQMSEVEIQDMKTKQGIEEIDLTLLSSYYGIIFTEFENRIKNKEKLTPVIKLYIPELAAYMGKKSNQTEEEIQTLIKNTQSFHNVIGVEHITRNGKPDKSYWPLLNFEGYDAKENSISFSSPYINHIIERIYNLSIRTDKKGKVKVKSDGTPLRVAINSYMIKPTIQKKPNKAAIENVKIIIAGIEKAGKNTYHISATTLINRNTQLKERLETSANPSQLLQRVFKNTWEYLRKETFLTDPEKGYKNIVLPDPKDPKAIPTLKTLDGMVFEFKHEGKIKK